MVRYGPMEKEPLWGKIIIKFSHLLLSLSSAINILIYSSNHLSIPLRLFLVEWYSGLTFARQALVQTRVPSRLTLYPVLCAWVCPLFILANLSPAGSFRLWSFYAYATPFFHVPTCIRLCKRRWRPHFANSANRTTKKTWLRCGVGPESCGTRHTR